ncbi:MAG: STAS domain-containing protein [Bacteroidaceae bacterium]|nr:STAS domain-containing protein [Bacteroidaceae bacterium]
MQINISTDNQNVRVCLVGELDSKATTEQAAELSKVLELADKSMEIDCSELAYISSAGLRFFMQVKRATETQGGTIRVTHLNEDVAEIFRMSGFLSIFDVE